VVDLYLGFVDPLFGFVSFVPELLVSEPDVSLWCFFFFFEDLSEDPELVPVPEFALVPEFDPIDPAEPLWSLLLEPLIEPEPLVPLCPLVPVLEPAVEPPPVLVLGCGLLEPDCGAPDPEPL
jgi:hypothetical protein